MLRALCNLMQFKACWLLLSTSFAWPTWSKFWSFYFFTSSWPSILLIVGGKTYVSLLMIGKCMKNLIWSLASSLLLHWLFKWHISFSIVIDAFYIYPCFYLLIKCNHVNDTCKGEAYLCHHHNNLCVRAYHNIYIHI